MNKNETSLPGCLSPMAIGAALIVAVLVLGFTFLQGGSLFSPGPLNAQAADAPLGGVKAHAQIRDCAACHPAPWSGQSMDAACQVCHVDVKNPANFHTSLLSKTANLKCTTCHVEHRGPDAALTQISTIDFPHEGIGFSLKVHQTMPDGSSIQCAACHKGKYAGTFNQTECADCHAALKDNFMPAHIAAFGANCLGCHDGLESYGRAFDHSQAPFALVGKHQPLDCVLCHRGATTIPGLKAASQACSACHAGQDAHQGRFGTNCATCHTPEDWKKATIDHSLTAFALFGKHTTVECQACHLNGVYKGTPQDCFSCHAKKDAHQGKFGTDCAACHTPEDWKKATFDHNLLAFKLVGKHLTAKCEACHLNSVFKGTPADCYSCHKKDDFHKGQYGTDCSVCHAPTAWKPSTFNHNNAFPLTGAHVRLSCQQCHKSGFKGAPTACAGCHADPAYHQGLFGLDCVACHATSAWLPAKYNRPHTAFPINHGGANICRDCHPGSLKSYACQSCHSGGEFSKNHQGVANLNDCLRCHPGGRGGD
jgi:hypothetical protein